MGKKVKLFTVETGHEFFYDEKKYVKTGKRNTGESRDILTGEDVVIASMKVVELPRNLLDVSDEVVPEVEETPPKPSDYPGTPFWARPVSIKDVEEEDTKI